MRKTPAAIGAAVLGAFLLLSGCHSGSNDTGAAKSAAASVTADPQFLAAKALVQKCTAGTPAQQVRQIHLVLLSSSTGKHGDEVKAARARLGSCLGISQADWTPFFNDAVTAAEHGHLLRSHANRVTYYRTTLPRLVLKYSNAAGVGTGTANIPGTSVSPSPSAS